MRSRYETGLRGENEATRLLQRGGCLVEKKNKPAYKYSRETKDFFGGKDTCGFDRLVLFPNDPDLWLVQIKYGKTARASALSAFRCLLKRPFKKFFVMYSLGTRAEWNDWVILIPSRAQTVERFFHFEEYDNDNITIESLSKRDA